MLEKEGRSYLSDLDDFIPEDLAEQWIKYRPIKEEIDNAKELAKTILRDEILRFGSLFLTPLSGK